MKYLLKNNRYLSTENWDERMGDISIEEFSQENGYKIVVDENRKEKLQKKEQYNLELSKIQQWFFQNDWIPNKIITGEWEQNDERWFAYLEQRQLKRTRQDELNKLLEE